MKTEESRGDLGTVKIHKKVIASIASIASTDIDGVMRVGGDMKTNIYDLFSKNSLAGIKVDIDKNNEIKLNVPLVVKYGYNIPEVADKVQENIHRVLEKMTSLSIKEININIQSIEK